MGRAYVPYRRGGPGAPAGVPLELAVRDLPVRLSPDHVGGAGPLRELLLAPPEEPIREFAEEGLPEKPLLRALGPADLQVRRQAQGETHVVPVEERAAPPDGVGHRHP